MILGLTGGIASGKSTVAALFGQLGVPIIDADQVARQVVEPGTAGLQAIVHQFGQQVLTPDGLVDRAWLRQQIFTHPAQKIALEAILHPLIRQQMQLEAQHHKDQPYIIFVIPLLYETGQKSQVDRILLVDCPEQLQIERLIQRDQTSRTQARQMLAAQASRSQRLSIADDIILNDGNCNLATEVQLLHTYYLSGKTRSKVVKKRPMAQP